MRVFIYRTDEGQILLSELAEETSIGGVPVTLVGYTILTTVTVQDWPLKEANGL